MKIAIENYLITWFKRCLTALLFLTFSRIVFIIYIFPFLKGAPMGQLPMVMLSGVLFDIQAIVYFLSIFHLLSLLPLNTSKKSIQISLKLSFIIGLTAILLLNFIDMEFFKIKTRRSGIELFQLVSDPSNPVISYVYNYWWLDRKSVV